MTKRNTKKALVVSLLSLLLCCSMLVGTTFAWFTDTVTSNQNTIVAGNLDVELYYQNDETNDWTKVDKETNVFKKNTLWEPGHTEVIKLRVVNEGTLALKYQLGVNIVSETGSVNVNNEAFKLSDHIKFGITAEEGAGYNRDQWIDEVDATATELNVAYGSGTVKLYPKTETNADNEDIVTMVVYMPTTVGNVANYKTGATKPTIELGLNLFATQLDAESDSFGDDYDKDSWANGVYVGTADDLQAAIDSGKTSIILSNDVEVEKSLLIPAAEAATFSMRSVATAVTIDLNGKTITGSMHKNVGSVIRNEGVLILKNGTVKSTGNNGGSAIVNKGQATVSNVTLNGAPNADGSWPSYTVNNTGKLTLNNCNITSYHGAVASYEEGALVTMNKTNIDMTGIPGFTNHGIYTYNDGAVVVNGGNIANNAADQTSTGASAINGNVTVNSGTITGRIENYYGTPVIKGGSFTVSPSKYLFNGCEVSKNDNGVYVVGYPQDSFDAAIENATGIVEIPAGEYKFPGSKLQAGVILDCADGTVFTGTSSLNINGATVKGATFENEGGQAVSGTINGTFENCTFKGEEALRWCYTTAGTTVVFENCVIETDFRGFHFDGMNGDVIFRNCEINGFNAYSGTGNITFENCVFGNDESKYNGLNIYANTTLENCTFNFVEGKTNFVDLEASGKILNINNCTATLNGKPTDLLAFVGGSKFNSSTVKVDGFRLISDGLTQDGVEYNVFNANGLEKLNDMMADTTAGRDAVVNLTADIDMTGKTWTTVDSHADTAFELAELNGNGHTISNLTINGQAMFRRFAGTGDVVIKDITFDKATVNSNGTINTSILTVQSYQNVLLDNVDVKNSTITGGYKVAPLIATVYNESASTVTATLKNCDVENVVVTATSYDFCTTGMVAFVHAGDNDKVEFENCTVKDVKLYAPNVYTAHAWVYTTGSETLFNEVEGVTVTNCTFENK